MAYWHPDLETPASRQCGRLFGHWIRPRGLFDLENRAAQEDRRTALKILTCGAVPGNCYAASAFGAPSIDSRYPNAFCEAERLENLDLNPRKVELIPNQSVARGCGVCVVVVMPPLAGGN